LHKSYYKLLSELTRDLKKRLSTVKGQIEGIIKMLDNETDHHKILVQFKAAGQGLRKAPYLLMDEAFRKSLAFYA